MPLQRLALEAVEENDDSSILDPATNSKSLKGSTLQSTAFGGFGDVGSASFVARSRGRKKKNA